MWQKLIWMALAGMLGTLARYGLSGLVQKSSGFPWGTLAVNIAGCFLAGALWSLFESRLNVAPLKPIVFIGFLGAFTTFSSYMLETANLVRDAEWLAAFGNIALQNVSGFAAVILGLACGRWLSGGLP